MQKFCYTCSPHKRQLSGGLHSKTCATCGELFDPNSARQRFCRKCSPWFPKHQKDNVNKPRNTKAIGPELTCVHCGAVYGNSIWVRKADAKKYPCPKCVPIIERKRIAEKIKHDRGMKKSWSRFGKWLLLAEEERVKHETDVCKYLPLWTRMRYVSQEEIELCRSLIIKKITTFGYCPELLGTKIDEVKAGSISVYRLTGIPSPEDYISKPGFYRVEKTYYDGVCFERVCAGGVPSHHTNGTRKGIEERIEAHARAGILKWREKEHKEWIAECRTKDARRRWNQSEVSKESVGFFRTLAMAGSVKTA